MGAASWLIALCVCAGGYGFNVDIESSVKHRGNPGSMFGFAVQEHVENGQKWVLVGAPEDDTGRAGLVRAGAVYRCDSERAGICTEIIFDATGNNNDTQYRQIDQKSNQWFGASLTSTGVDGAIVACAPRYVSYVTAKLNQRDPVGTCFVAKKSFTDINEYSPCRTSNYGHRRTGVCQAGFSAAVSKDGGRLFLGAPGSYYWQGQAFSIETSERFHFYMPKIPQGSRGQLYSQSLESRPVLVATPEGSYKYDDTYMGYSVAVGDFAGQGIQGVAVGVPRGSELRGLVVLYTWELENIKNISGQQIGAYFGYCIASGDIDGDGLDDVIVGAPMFTLPNNEGSYEHGRVYVIYQGRSEIPYKVNHYRTGEISKGRFGLSLTSLGDINLDTFGDFAVGAPYGGKNGRGVVYIYHGSKDGVREKYSQAITAEEVAPALSTFGFSLSGGVDLDENQYTDLVVGAYKSDTAIFFKSRPVVKVTASVQFETGSTKLISLDDTRCQLRSGKAVACADINYCFQYSGINVDRQIEFELSLNLDSQQTRSPRLFFLNDELSHTSNQTIILNREQFHCNKTTVYVVDEVRDKLTPLEVAMTYNLKSRRYSTPGYIPPVLDMNAGNVQRDSINIQKNCGPDNVCIPNLKMVITPSVTKYLLGSNENLGIDVYIENSAEDAFEATYYLQIPPGIHFVKIERLETGNIDNTPVYCSTPINHADGNNTIKCDVGNPLPMNQMVNFRVVLQPEHLEGMSPSYEFQMEANSTNKEIEGTTSDNTHHLSIGVWVDTNISIIGVSKPPDLHYNASHYQSVNLTADSQLGPQVIHVYGIKNNGPSAINEAEVFLVWPYQTLAGEDLFYAVVQPETQGDLKCEMAPHVNDLHLTVEDRHKSFLQLAQQGIIDKESGLTVDGSTNNFNRGSSNSNSSSFATSSSSSSSSFGKGGQVYTLDEKWKIEEEQRRKQGFNQDSYSSNNRNEGFQSGSQYEGSSENRREYGENIENRNSFGENSQGSSRNEQGFKSSSQNGGSYQNSNQFGTNYQNRNQNGQDGTLNVREGSYSGEHGIVRHRSGQGPLVVKQWNQTTTIDGHGNVHKTESSTEFSTLGHEGEEGSSYNNRFSGSGVYNKGSEAHSSRGGVYNHGSYAQSGTGGYGGGSSQASNERNEYYARNAGGSWNHGYNASTGLNNDQRHTWSTEETVNKDLINAGSKTYVQGSSGSSGRSDAGVTIVGGDEEELGGFASVAGNSNNEFRTSVADLGVLSGGSQGGAAYGGGAAYEGGSQSSMSRGSSSQGSVTYGSGSQSGGSRSGMAYGGVGAGSESSSNQNGYSYSSSSSGGSQTGTSQSQNRHYSYSASSGASASQDGPQYIYKQNERTRRQAPEFEDKDLNLVLQNCTNKYKCAVMRCITGPMYKDQEVWLALRGRINAKVLNEISKERSVLLSSLVGARVTQLPYVGRPREVTLETFEAQTQVTPQLEAPESGSIPLWVVVLAACAGALLLLLLILLLYKCGFFKRNRPSDQPERQPLNRNGYGHADEQL